MTHARNKYGFMLAIIMTCAPYCANAAATKWRDREDCISYATRSQWCYKHKIIESGYTISDVRVSTCPSTSGYTTQKSYYNSVGVQCIITSVNSESTHGSCTLVNSDLRCPSYRSKLPAIGKGESYWSTDSTALGSWEEVIETSSTEGYYESSWTEYRDCAMIVEQSRDIQCSQCNSGYYLGNYGNCVACPEYYDEEYHFFSALSENATASNGITACYIPANGPKLSDSSGSYVYPSNCYYVK